MKTLFSSRFSLLHDLTLDEELSLCSWKIHRIPPCLNAKEMQENERKGREI